MNLELNCFFLAVVHDEGCCEACDRKSLNYACPHLRLRVRLDFHQFCLIGRVENLRLVNEPNLIETEASSICTHLRSLVDRQRLIRYNFGFLIVNGDLKLVLFNAANLDHRLNCVVSTKRFDVHAVEEN